MTENSFFDTPREQSLIKARIVEKYFWAWAKVMIGQMKKRPVKDRRIAYIDLFAGAGRYKDDSKSTPVKVLEKALADPEMRSMLISIFNDADKDNVDSLQKTIESIPNIGDLKYSPKILNYRVGEEIVPSILDDIKSAPALLFLDPWGYKGLSLKLIKSFLKNWECDCIFFFNYNRINMSFRNLAVQEHIDALFGKERGTQVREKLHGLSPQERESKIVETIREALQDIGGKYPLHFPFKYESGTRTSHHLIFVTKSDKGYKIMKDIMAKESSEQDQGVPSFEYNPASSRQLSLFELSRPLDNLESMLLETFAGQTMTMQDIYECHHVGKPYIKKNYKDALRSLESQGKIIVDPPANKRRKQQGEVTFADQIKVTFPSKQ